MWKYVPSRNIWLKNSQMAAMVYIMSGCDKIEGRQDFHNDWEGSETSLWAYNWSRFLLHAEKHNKYKHAENKEVCNINLHKMAEGDQSA